MPFDWLPSAIAWLFSFFSLSKFRKKILVKLRVVFGATIEKAEQRNFQWNVFNDHHFSGQYRKWSCINSASDHTGQWNRKALGTDVWAAWPLPSQAVCRSIGKHIVGQDEYHIRLEGPDLKPNAFSTVDVFSFSFLFFSCTTTFAPDFWVAISRAVVGARELSFSASLFLINW